MYIQIYQNNYKQFPMLLKQDLAFTFCQPFEDKANLLPWAFPEERK